ncbi:hypothetical protein [Streptomonospora litoralis]|uniref:Uncharacterized protein n=1 Tax=Streptomonospora litoralis TaxID=2498135 RepID=A0A4P6Q201_9ACTN|nr:hypothetical protein [Streptomonospora litoralis]QBI53271.1 hypothetical protein EKD16_07375 [Streptomonospora litoralis]
MSESSPGGSPEEHSAGSPILQPSFAGADADSAGSGGVFARYKVPVIAGAVVAGVAAALILPVWLAPEPPYTDVGDCAELFGDGFVGGLPFEGVRMEEGEFAPGHSGSPLTEDPDAVRKCIDTGAGRLSVTFTWFGPEVAIGAQELVGLVRGFERGRVADGPFSTFGTAELEDLDVGDGGFVALYSPPEHRESDYREWIPTDDGKSHATAVFSTRNVVVEATVYGKRTDTFDSPKLTARSMADDVLERLAEVGEVG